MTIGFDIIHSMDLEGLRRGWNLWKICNSPESLEFIVDPNTSLDIENHHLISEFGKGKPKVGGTALILLEGAPESLSSDERLAVVLFSGMVYHADDILDNSRQVFSSHGELTDFLLDSPIRTGNDHITFGEVFNRTLKLLPSGKKQALNHFVEEMVDLHIRVGNYGEVGEYGFEDVWKYKLQCNLAFARTGFAISESNLRSSSNLSTSLLALQMYDDVQNPDIVEDSSNISILSSPTVRSRDEVNPESLSYNIR